MRPACPALALVLPLLLAACGAEPSRARLARGGGAPAHAALGFFDDVLARVDEALSTTPLQRQRAHCEEEGGAWVDSVVIGPCEDGQMLLRLDDSEYTQRCADGTGYTGRGVCAHLTDAGVIFNDGPSVPHVLQALGSSLGADADIGPWNDIFWGAAVNHDYCYHHNGITYGLTQQDCDHQMFSDLSAICLAPGYDALAFFTQERCRARAALCLASLRGVGAAAFAMMNTEVAYPAWEPLWQRFGMREDPADAAIAARIEELLGAGSAP